MFAWSKRENQFNHLVTPSQLAVHHSSKHVINKKH